MIEVTFAGIELVGVARVERSHHGPTFTTTTGVHGTTRNRRHAAGQLVIHFETATSAGALSLAAVAATDPFALGRIKVVDDPDGTDLDVGGGLRSWSSDLTAWTFDTASLA